MIIYYDPTALSAFFADIHQAGNQEHNLSGEDNLPGVPLNQGYHNGNSGCILLLVFYKKGFPQKNAGRTISIGRGFPENRFCVLLCHLFENWFHATFPLKSILLQDHPIVADDPQIFEAR